MNTQDAKFILRAHRDDGRYPADDLLFAEALAATARDPALADWLEREHTLDGTIAGKLDGLLPPAGLRDAILVGARASQLSRRWWRNPAWFIAAASLAVLLAIGTLITRPTPAGAAPATLAEFSLDQLAFARHGHSGSPDAAALQARLTASAGPLCDNLDFDCGELARRGCHELDFGGRRVYEVCFRREGVWYHLYVTSRDSTGDSLADTPQFIERNGLAAATWARGATVFALATTAGREALGSVF